MSQREEEREQARREEHHLDGLRHHHHGNDVELLGLERGVRAGSGHGATASGVPARARVGLLGTILAQRTHLVADRGDHEEQGDERPEIR